MFLRWLWMYSIISIGIIISLGILTGGYQSFKKILGYDNDILFGKNIGKGKKGPGFVWGKIPASFLIIDFFTIIGTFIWLRLNLGGNITNLFLIILAGIIILAVYTCCSYITSMEINDISDSDDPALGFILLLGFLWGGLLATLFLFDWFDRKIVPSFFFGTMCLGSLFLFNCYFVILFPVEIARRAVYTFLPFFLAPLFFKKSICSGCLRYSIPSNARYDFGIRKCEYCNQVIDKIKDSNKVIFTFGDWRIGQANRSFILSNPDFEKKTSSMDVSEVYIDTATVDKLLIEKFITYIRNYPPRYGLKSVRVFFKGNLDDLGYLQRQILNNFKIIKEASS